MGWRYTRLPCDREKKLGVAFEILAQKPAFGGINLKIGRRTWLYAGERPHHSPLVASLHGTPSGITPPGVIL